MDKRRQNQLLIKYLDLGQHGFKCVFEDDRDRGNRFVKRYNDSNAYIEFKIFRNKFFGLLCWIENISVESIMNDLLIQLDFKSDYRPQTLSSGPFISQTIKNGYKKHLDVQEVDLTTEDQIQNTALKIWDVIQDLYMPFFEKYTNLQTINDEIINRVTHLETAEYINLYMPFKKMIIMKLCKNPDYGDYSNWLHSRLKERRDKGEGLEYYQLFIDLCGKLDRDY